METTLLVLIVAAAVVLYVTKWLPIAVTSVLIPPALYFTGGQAELAAEVSEIVDRVAPDLCLRGAAIAYYKAFERNLDSA